MSDRLRAQYPDEMTIILQHQFWDLKVSEDEFEVGLSFGGVPEHLTVPFDAINGFFDPSVQFGLQFEEVAEGEERSGTCQCAGARDQEKAIAEQSAAGASGRCAHRPRSYTRIHTQTRKA